MSYSVELTEVFKCLHQQQHAMVFKKAWMLCVL